jgi:hypothetical protein
VVPPQVQAGACADFEEPQGQASLPHDLQESREQGPAPFDLIGLHASRRRGVRNGFEQMRPERVFIGLPTGGGVEARGSGQLSLQDHPVNGSEEQQRREHPRARHMRLERGEARAAGAHVLRHAPQERFVHRRAEVRSPPCLVQASLSDVLAIHVSQDRGGDSRAPPCR